MHRHTIGLLAPFAKINKLLNKLISEPPLALSTQEYVAVKYGTFA